MSKVLVISGANFYDNKLDTITFDDGVPCTGIQLNVNNINFNALQSTYTLTPTVTPSNTTDALIWSSSNTAIATVSSSGVVTSKGVGTATITVRCGGYSASCTVISTVRYVDSDLLKSNYGVIAYSFTSGNDAAQLVTQSTYPIAAYALASAPTTGAYEVAVNSSETVGRQVFGIPIPANASTLTITLPDTTGTKLRLANISYHNSKELQTSVAGVTACKFISNKTYNAADFEDSGKTITIDLSYLISEVDSICFYVQTTGAAVTVTDPITFLFS